MPANFILFLFTCTAIARANRYHDFHAEHGGPKSSAGRQRVKGGAMQLKYAGTIHPHVLPLDRVPYSKIECHPESLVLEFDHVPHLKEFHGELGLHSRLMGDTRHGCSSDDFPEGGLVYRRVEGITRSGTRLILDTSELQLAELFLDIDLDVKVEQDRSNQNEAKSEETKGTSRKNEAATGQRAEDKGEAKSARKLGDEYMEFANMDHTVKLMDINYNYDRRNRQAVDKRMNLLNCKHGGVIDSAIAGSPGGDGLMTPVCNSDYIVKNLKVTNTNK